MKILKIVIPVIFGIVAVLSVVLFSFGGSRNGTSGNDGQTVVVWGSFPASSVSNVLSNLEIDTGLTAEYVEIERSIFETSLIRALADGVGPDMLILPQDLLLVEKNKFFPLSYDVYPSESFTSTFARASEIFLTQEGVYGIPLVIDPIVMYWNRDLFINEGLAEPPKYWKEFFSLASKLTKFDIDGDLTQSFVAMGVVGNINYAKEILSAMFMQTGEEIIRETAVGLEPTFGGGGGAGSVLDFYTEFSNTRKPAYSWNSSLPDSVEAFAAGDLAIYFGLASDNSYIQALNPNLDYGVASFPQIESSERRSTFGYVYSFVLLKNSPNIQAAYNLADAIVSGGYSDVLAKNLGMAPARIDQLGVIQTDTFFPVVYDSAIKTRVWLDPEPNETRRIFDRMVSTITVSRESSSQATEIGRNLIVELIRKLR